MAQDRLVLDHKNRLEALLPEWRRGPGGEPRTRFAFVCPGCFEDLEVEASRVVDDNQERVTIHGAVRHTCGFLGTVRDGFVLYRLRSSP